MKFTIILAILLVPLVGTAYAESLNANVFTIEIPEENDFVDMIIEMMNSIFGIVYQVEDNPKLQQWANDIIQDQVERTENKINNQLENTP